MLNMEKLWEIVRMLLSFAFVSASYLSSALIVTAGGRNSYKSIWLNIPQHFSRHGWIDCGSGYDVQVLQETQI
jgi:hypothetical protein